MSGPSCLVCVSPGHTVGGWDQTCAPWHSPELLSLTLIRDTQSWRSSKGHLRVVLVNHNTFYFGRSLRDLAFSRCVSMLIDGDRLSLGRKILLQCCFLSTQMVFFDVMEPLMFHTTSPCTTPSPKGMHYSKFPIPNTKFADHAHPPPPLAYRSGT